ncbi:MAG: hypothetical protein QOJ75_1368, partial [Chloroflexota bacterium]|nr:hypothetical protein [Chloroflexota bacterium]
MTSKAMLPKPADPIQSRPPGSVGPLTRRGFLRGAALTGGGLVAVGVAACVPSAGAPTWSLGPGVSPGSGAGPAA